ncbi:MAG: uncharacterized protein A8A55_2788 [Amphiamblys sp. WSBS2006]|nr:MAG: uncharacterized protein A8A55_2788 [Amphiamblys sp. WSBS2006]
MLQDTCSECSVREMTFFHSLRKEVAEVLRSEDVVQKRHITHSKRMPGTRKTLSWLTLGIDLLRVYQGGCESPHGGHVRDIEGKYPSREKGFVILKKTRNRHRRVPDTASTLKTTI